MQSITIDNTTVPKLGFGTYTLTGNACREAVQDALAIGYRHIDTARMYGNEKEVGDGIKAGAVSREELFLTTKVWYTELQPQQVRRELESALQKLQTGYVDLYLIHWPAPDMDLEATLEAMFRLRDEGKCRQVGVSNFTPSLMDQASKVGKIFCNQVEYHPYLAQSRLQEKAVNENFMLTAYSPVAKGKVFQDKLLKNLAGKHNKSAGQVVLRWLMQQQNVAAIPRASSHKHRLENFNIFDFTLDDGDMEKIAQLAYGYRLINPSWAPQWE